MKKTKRLPDIEYLKRLFRLEKSTGKLFWNARPESDFAKGEIRTSAQIANNWNSKHAGKEAGTLGKENRTIVYIDRIPYLSHRVVFAVANNKDPFPFEVDHRNKNAIDNRPRNLRKATPSENCSNKNAYSNNKLGIKGVYAIGKKFRSEIMKNGKHIFLGYFDTKRKAATAYARAAKEHHGEFSRQ